MILWEILHDTVPFDNDLRNVANFIIKEDVRPKIQPSIPASVASLIRRCWQKDPSKRPKNFAEICEELQKMLEE